MVSASTFRDGPSPSAVESEGKEEIRRRAAYTGGVPPSARVGMIDVATGNQDQRRNGRCAYLGLRDGSEALALEVGERVNALA